MALFLTDGSGCDELRTIKLHSNTSSYRLILLPFLKYKRQQYKISAQKTRVFSVKKA